jgi:hypothetical protein
MSKSRDRKRKYAAQLTAGPKFHLVYGLAQSIIRGLAIVAVSMCGVFGFGLSGCPPGTVCSNRTSVAALAAAPISSSLVVPLKVAFTRWYAPPAYARVTFVNTQSVQSRPSKICLTPLISAAWRIGTPQPMAGICGVVPSMYNPSPGGAPPLYWLSKKEVLSIMVRHGGRADEGACAHVDVWFPSKNIQQAPTMNDPNAKVILDITPPSSGMAGNCSMWKYHDGEAPPTKPRRIIRQQRKSADLIP